jgi:hypothetical protein
MAPNPFPALIVMMCVFDVKVDVDIKIALSKQFETQMQFMSVCRTGSDPVLHSNDVLYRD